MTNSLDTLSENLQELIEVKRIELLRIYTFSPSLTEFESKEWTFEGQFIKTEFAHLDMLFLTGYKIEAHVLCLHFNS